MLRNITNIAAILALAAAFYSNAIYHMHMFQLNSYKHKEHFAWLIKGDSIRRLIGVDIWYIPAAFLFTRGAAGMLAGAALLFVTAWLQRPKKAKKPLVYTARVDRMFLTMTIVFFGLLYGSMQTISSIWNTQSSNTFPIVMLCFLILSPFFIFLANIINKPIEKMIRNWYIREAKELIDDMPNMTVVGITGSYGKTSVKFFLQKLLSANYHVLITPENYNTTLGVVKTIRENLKATHEIFICEMGARNIGDIKEICDLVHPKHGIITSIGPQHLDSFHTVENIIKTKFELANAVPDYGMVFLNLDNEYIQNSTRRGNAVTYGIWNQDSGYRAYEIQVSQKGSTFLMVLDGKETTFTTKLIGEHNVLNIAAAVAVAHKLHVPVDVLVRQVRKLESVPHRLQLIKRGDMILIDDAYNSNPVGAKAALDTLAMFHGAKIIVTPGMIELGTKQFECNKIFGEQIAKVCDYVVLVGAQQTKPIQEGLIQRSFPGEQLYIASNLEDALKQVNAWDSKGRQKVVLLENDLPDNYS